MTKEEALGGYDPVAEGDQDERGVDLIGIRYNLALTPSERVEQHRQASASIAKLKDLVAASRSRPVS